MRFSIKWVLVLLTFVVLGATGAAAEAPDFAAMLKAVDANGDFGSQDYSAMFTIVTQKPTEKDSVMQVKLFRRDNNDQMVWIMQKPEAQKGQGFLKVDENVWMYDPESGKYSHSTMKETIQNSKAKSSDLKKTSYGDDYTVAAWEEGMLRAEVLWVLSQARWLLPRALGDDGFMGGSLGGPPRRTLLVHRWRRLTRSAPARSRFPHLVEVLERAASQADATWGAAPALGLYPAFSG